MVLVMALHIMPVLTNNAVGVTQVLPLAKQITNQGWGETCTRILVCLDCCAQPVYKWKRKTLNLQLL